MIPGPRPSDGLPRPLAGSGDPAGPPIECEPAPVALIRTPAGWVVRSATGSQAVGDVVEGMSLADLITEEHGRLPEPDRSARRSARGPASPAAEVPVLDESALRIAALERTVAQLEHALAARVATERAIGVLAERQALSARAAFEALRREARSQGRPVAELARGVLDGLAPDVPDAARPVAAADGRS
ncbi:ANTAR domain-containing protein [Blastococcus sp. SYSU D01042]